MTCGDCKHWNPIRQGETYNDLFETMMVFCKVVGDCEYHADSKYPMYNNELCKCKARIKKEAKK
jgi:hypothetical protein